MSLLDVFVVVLGGGFFVHSGVAEGFFAEVVAGLVLVVLFGIDDLIMVVMGG